MKKKASRRKPLTDAQINNFIQDLDDDSDNQYASTDDGVGVVEPFYYIVTYVIVSNFDQFFVVNN